MSLFFLRCVAKAACNAIGGGVVGDVLFDILPEVAGQAYKWWSGDRTPEQRAADLAAVATATPVEVRKATDDIVLEFAAEKTASQRQAIALYLSLIPGQIRKSLRRPGDPGGTTVQLHLAPAKGEDLVPLLPTKLPRFSPGSRPLPGVDWELEELLGVGGFGEVWKARNPMISSMPPVALKFCLDASAGHFLKNEAAVLNQVMRQGRHPGIVTLERTYLSSETPCLEYEYVLGGDLAGLIKEWHRSTPRPGPLEITRHFLTLCEIVGFAHSQLPPIVHRDLKPANILCEIAPDGQWRLKVADFGIGGLAIHDTLRQQTAGTSHGMFLASALKGSCTPLYASPQQMKGGPADPRDDVFSLGVIWHQMLTGDLASGKQGGMRWQKRLVEAGLPGSMAELMGDCFEDDAEHRLPDAGTLARKLGALMPSAAPPPPTLVLKPPPPPPPKLPFPEQNMSATWQRDQDKKKREEELVLRLADLNAEVSRRPDDARLLAERGEVFRQLGKHEQAIADCTEAILLMPSLGSAYATRGSAHRLKGQLDLAIADCTRAVELDPCSLLAWYNRAEAYRLRTDLDKAIADCTKALELDPTYSWAYGTRGAARRQKGDLAGALLDLDETLQLDPGYVWAWAVRGEAHRLKGEHDKAIADCTEALKLEPQSSLALATRGAAFRQKGDFATAQEDLNKAVRLRPDYEWARQQLELARKRQR